MCLLSEKQVDNLSANPELSQTHSKLAEAGVPACPESGEISPHFKAISNKNNKKHNKYPFLSEFNDAPQRTLAIFLTLLRISKYMTTTNSLQAAAVPTQIKSDDSFRRQRSRLLNFIRRRVLTKEDAEDLVQDVFYQLASSDNADEPIGQLTAWLYTVAKNKIIDWYRKRKPIKRLSYWTDDEEDSDRNLAELISDPATNPETLLDRAIFWSELESALAELPEAQREAFIMHELQGKSFTEIADETGEALNTLLSRKHRATAKLRKRLQDSWNQKF